MKKMRLIFLITALLGCFSFAWGQVSSTPIKIEGKVFDESNYPMPGVNISIEGTTEGTASISDGSFSITVPSRKTVLVFSFIGYKTQKIEVGNRTDWNVRMVIDATQIEEVVIVGYGTQKKVNLTGSVANVNVKEAISSRPVTDVAKALQGITPGLTISNYQGGVGRESVVKLRGATGSLNATSGTTPLILVDNVEIPSLNLINPEDIETISVLKDAAASAIYGTRATWGVILITTKQGKLNEKTRVTYSNNFAWSTPTKMPKQASAYDNAVVALQVAHQLGKPMVSSIGYNIDEEAIGKIKDWEEKYGHMSQSALGEMQLGRDFEIRGGKTFFYRSFDPIKEFTHKWTPQQTHNISISGGGAKTAYNVSFGYLSQSGVMKFNTDKYERFNLGSNISTQIRDWWKFRTNLLLTRSDKSQPYRYTSGIYDAWYYLLRWPRWYPYADYEGKPFRSAVTDIKYANREHVYDNYARINLGSEFTPIKGLSVNVDYTFSLLNTYQKKNGGTIMAYNSFVTNPTENYVDIYQSGHDRVIQTSQYSISNVFKGYATYEHTFAEKHHATAMVGMDAETREKFSHYSERRGLINYDQPEIALTTGDQYSSDGTYTYHNDFASMGYFFRINYDYAQKYLLEVNGRYDGSSKFPKGDKWAFFPSFSAGWRISEENFMNWATPVLSNLKLRGSWGMIGNQDVAANAFLSTMSNSNGSGWVINDQETTYITSPSVVSAALTWEKVTTLNLALETGFFNNELAVTFEWYKRTTSDMHSPGQTLPSSFGASSPLINYGEMEAKGYEISAEYNHRFENGLGISLRANLSDVVEKITKYNNTTKNIYNNYEGKRLGEIWGYETDRLFQESDFENGQLKAGIPSQALFESGAFKYGPGDVKYKNLDGDDKISYGSNTVDDHGDLKVIGNTRPRYEYSFSLGLNWKGFDFSTFFQGVGKKDLWGVGAVAIPGFMDGEAWYQHHMDYWTPENTNAHWPRPVSHSWISNGRNFLRQTRYLADLSYLRCKNITFGYTLPERWMKKITFQSARIYVSAENVFEFSNVGLPVDPESTENKDGDVQGYSFGRSYPYSRTVSFGIQVGF